MIRGSNARDAAIIRKTTSANTVAPIEGLDYAIPTIFATGITMFVQIVRRLND
ncbi:hypothetical protein SAMN05192539_104855 [Paraburkholderia diazotrophica]|uniref:Uncharacterized protein n=1 Tax=Paraburkholderia diazotrophica TaxID=667676 RepID=A0A1H7EC69_9BURK|nr:hypothetical protein SAMN05192539_104855 [Paraburkholderia diazotrophica]